MRLPNLFRPDPQNTFPSAGMTLLRNIPTWLEDLVRRDLTFPNTDFYSRRGPDEPEPPDVEVWRPHPEGVLVPRHYWRAELASFGRVVPVPGDVGDFVHRLLFPPRPEQVPLLRQLDGMVGDVGIQAPPAFGKTYSAFYRSTRHRGRILVISPGTNKLNEWREAAKKFLGLRDDQIGHVQGSKRRWKDCPVTLATDDTLSQQEFDLEFQTGFRSVISDESHLSNSAIISRGLGVAAGDRLALTATPGKGSRRRIVELHFGSRWLEPQVDQMPCRVEFVPVPVGRWLQKMDWEKLMTFWGRDDFYVDTAARICAQLLEQRRRVLVLSNQTKPLYRVYNYLEERGGFVVGDASLKDMMQGSGLLRGLIEATGESNWAKRSAAYMAKVKAEMNPILGTGLTKAQPAGVGMDVPDLDGGVLMLPLGSPDMVTQVMGRFRRKHPKQEPLVIVMVPYTGDGMKRGATMQGHLSRMDNIEVYEHPPVGRAY